MSIKTSLYQYAIRHIRVVDGDTLEGNIDLGFNVELKNVKVRLAGVDCPEKSTPEGITSRDFTSQWISAAEGECKDVVISVKNHKRDKYGRILGMITVDGQSLTDVLLINKLGKPYSGGKR
jgi:endonuclease YncB( thermonuclease family)